MVIEQPVVRDQLKMSQYILRVLTVITSSVCSPVKAIALRARYKINTMHSLYTKTQQILQRTGAFWKQQKVLGVVYLQAMEKSKARTKWKQEESTRPEGGLVRALIADFQSHLQSDIPTSGRVYLQILADCRLQVIVLARFLRKKHMYKGVTTICSKMSSLLSFLDLHKNMAY